MYVHMYIKWTQSPLKGYTVNLTRHSGANGLVWQSIGVATCCKLTRSNDERAFSLYLLFEGLWNLPKIFSRSYTFRICKKTKKRIFSKFLGVCSPSRKHRLSQRWRIGGKSTQFYRSFDPRCTQLRYFSVVISLSPRTALFNN